MNCALSVKALATVTTFGVTNDCSALLNPSLDPLRDYLDVASCYDIVGLSAKTKMQVTAKVHNKPAEASGVLETGWSSYNAAAFYSGTFGVVSVTALLAIER